MGARENILGRIRASKSIAGAAADERIKAVKTRLGETPRGIIPARGQLPKKDRVDLFESMAQSVSATVARVSDYKQIAGEVSRYLREKNLPASIRIGEDKRLAGAGWKSEKTLETLSGASDGTDLAGLSHAFTGIAETGTLALLSGPENPTTINFLPEHHIVAVKADDIVGDLESAWAALRKQAGKGGMPRVLNLVTGPSRSGDIEQTILLGAHGPKALHIIIVE